jgi:methionyl-tRNA synthetase
MLSPVMPVASAKIYEQIGIPVRDKEFDLESMGTWGSFKGLTRLGEREILFPRIKEE